MANIENLNPGGYKFSKADQSKGGRVSAEKKRERKMFREIFTHMLELPIGDGEAQQLEQIKNLAEVNGMNLTSAQAISLAILQNALNGDVKAFEVIAKIMGENEELTGNIGVQIIDDISGSK